MSSSPPGESAVGPAIEADTSDRSDTDSALDVQSLGSDSESITSSILRFRHENGRTYHAYKEGSYVLPNDGAEIERLDLQHNIVLLTLGGKLHLAPIGEDGRHVSRVLDAGTGTGIWAMDFADEHPEAHVIGIDLSPIQPSFVPPNVGFYVDDLEAEWSYTAPFDFIYVRTLAGSLKEWPKLYRQAYDNLSPGGYIELFEPNYPIGSDDNSLPADSALLRWSRLWQEGAAKSGLQLLTAEQHKAVLEQAGFVNIVERNFKWPLNTWPKDPKYKELGSWVYEVTSSGLQAMTMALFTRVLGWSAEAVELFLVDVRKDVGNRRYHAYWSIFVLYAQKPA
ncbi:hypothetical protein RB597_003803 [Gaeumannomyces tritici]